MGFPAYVDSFVIDDIATKARAGMFVSNWNDTIDLDDRLRRVQNQFHIFRVYLDGFDAVASVTRHAVKTKQMTRNHAQMIPYIMMKRLNNLEYDIHAVDEKMLPDGISDVLDETRERLHNTLFIDPPEPSVPWMKRIFGDRVHDTKDGSTILVNKFEANLIVIVVCFVLLTMCMPAIIHLLLK